MSYIKKHIEAAAFFIVLFFIIAMIIVVNSYENYDTGFYKGFEIEKLTNGWTMKDSTGQSRKTSLPINVNVSDDVIVEIERVLPDEIDLNTSICFRTSHARVAVLIEDEIIYDYAWDGDIPLGESPGGLWNIVELKPEYAGKVITIKAYSPYSNYNGMFRSVIYGSKNNIILYILNETFWMFFFSCIPLVLGVLLLFIALFSNKDISGKPFLYIGIFMLIVGIWEMTESGYLQFKNGHMFTMQILNLLTFGFIPLSAVMALRYTNMLKYHYNKLFWSNVAAFCVYLLSQLVGIADMTSIMWIIHIMVIVDSVFVFIDTKKYCEEMEENGRFWFITMTYAFVFVSIVIDIYRVYIYPDSYNGYVTRIAIVIFILLMGINIIYASMALQRSNVERETIISMAYTDNLTGINNRRCFEEDTEKLVDAKKNFTVVAIDMNNLKMINDELGHKFGDEALIKVAEALKMFEKFGEKCYRMGGDEFEVICTHMTGEEIDNLCEKINAELGKTEYFPGKPLSMAYGYFRFSANMDKEINKVLAQADKKMYEKKAKMKAMGYATRD